MVERDYRLKFFLVSWEDTKTWFVPGGGREGSPPPSQASRERLTAVLEGEGSTGGIHGLTGDARVDRDPGLGRAGEGPTQGRTHTTPASVVR